MNLKKNITIQLWQLLLAVAILLFALGGLGNSNSYLKNENREQKKNAKIYAKKYLQEMQKAEMYKDSALRYKERYQYLIIKYPKALQNENTRISKLSNDSLKSELSRIK